MNNLIPGILTVSFCISGYYLSWRSWKKENFKAALLLILICGLTLRIYTSTDGYVHTWDERYHALVAKNLINHPLIPTLYDNPVLPYSYKDWVANHVWLEKGPVPLWAMAASLSAFGNTDFALRVPSLIISLIAVYLTYLIGSRLFGKRTGLLAAFFHSINGLIIELAAGRISSDHVETFFIFFIELAVFVAVLSISNKRNKLYPVLIGAITGMAFLCKWTPALIVFPVWIIAEILVANKTKWQIFLNVSASVLGFTLISAPWLLYIFNQFPDESAWVFKKFIFAYSETLEQHSGQFYHYFQNLGMVFGEIIWIPVIISMYQIFRKQDIWKMAMLNVWWLIPFIMFSFAATKRHTYLLLAAPAIFIILSWCWFYIHEQNVIKNKLLRNIVLILLVALPVRYCIERTKPFTDIERNPQWASDLKQMRNKYDAKTIFFNHEHAIEGMYYTNYIFYTHIPEKSQIEFLERKGYRVIVR